MVKKDLFKQTVFKSATYYVFHDESLPNKRWLLIGLLFVNEQDLAYVKEVLKTVKEKSDCESEIHFSKLPTSFKGSFSSKALVAQKWMRLFENRFKEYLSCTILIIDKFSNNFQRDKFAKDYYTYNRFTALALKCGIAWHLSKENIDKLMVNFVSDKKDRVSMPEKSIQDNFEEYIPFRAVLDSLTTDNPYYPQVEVHLQTRDSAQEDLLQFVDLLLGSTQAALVGEVRKRTKIWFAQRILDWKLRNKLRGKFDILLFPDENGCMTKQIPFQLKPEGMLF